MIHPVFHILTTIFLSRSPHFVHDFIFFIYNITPVLSTH